MVYTNFPNEYNGTEQGIYLGGIGTLASQADTTPTNQVGIVTRQDGNLYRYVYFVTTIAGTAAASVVGAPAYWAPTFDPANGIWTVTSDYDTSGKSFAGVLLAAGITTGRYIWVQVGGVHSALVVTSAAVGNRLRGVADATFAPIANSSTNYETAEVVAICTTAGSGTCGATLCGANII